LRASASSCDVVVQVPGVISVLSIDAFYRELDSKSAFHSIVTKYAQAFVAFITQSVACNALHSAEARCCRWLLHQQDRLETSDLRLTHEFLSTMLGVRRPTVTLIMSDLACEGIISTGRGRIRIVSRDALEQRSCGCYQSVTAAFDALLPRDEVQPGRPEGADLHNRQQPEQESQGAQR